MTGPAIGSDARPLPGVPLDRLTAPLKRSRSTPETRPQTCPASPRSTSFASTWLGSTGPIDSSD